MQHFDSNHLPVMKNILLAISALLITSLYSCGETQKPESVGATAAVSHVAVSTADTRATADIAPIKTESNKVFIIGSYCGECASHCNTFFRYEVRAEGPNLKGAISERHEEYNSSSTFLNTISDPRIISLADSLCSQIPDTMDVSHGKQMRFGCPDCRDQCGYYFCVYKNGKVYQSLIDTDASDLPDNMRSFQRVLSRFIFLASSRLPKENDTSLLDKK